MGKGSHYEPCGPSTSGSILIYLGYSSPLRWPLPGSDNRGLRTIPRDAGRPPPQRPIRWPTEWLTGWPRPLRLKNSQHSMVPQTGWTYEAMKYTDMVNSSTSLHLGPCWLPVSASLYACYTEEGNLWILWDLVCSHQIHQHRRPSEEAWMPPYRDHH